MEGRTKGSTSIEPVFDGMMRRILIMNELNVPEKQNHTIITVFTLLKNCSTNSTMLYVRPKTVLVNQFDTEARTLVH